MPSCWGPSMDHTGTRICPLTHDDEFDCDECLVEETWE